MSVALCHQCQCRTGEHERISDHRFGHVDNRGQDASFRVASEHVKWPSRGSGVAACLGCLRVHEEELKDAVDDEEDLTHGMHEVVRGEPISRYSTNATASKDPPAHANARTRARAARVEVDTRTGKARRMLAPLLGG